MEYLILSTAFILGLVITYILLKSSFLKQKFELEKTSSLLEDRNQLLQKEKEELTLQINQFRSENTIRSQQLARAEADYSNLQEKLELQKKEMGTLQQKFTIGHHRHK